jgi:hypothetical protein
MAKVELARWRVLRAAKVLADVKVDASDATADAVDEWICALHAYEVALFEFGHDWHHVMSDEVVEEYEVMQRVDETLSPVFMRVIHGEVE